MHVLNFRQVTQQNVAYSVTWCFGDIIHTMLDISWPVRTLMVALGPELPGFFCANTSRMVPAKTSFHALTGNNCFVLAKNTLSYTNTIYASYTVKRGCRTLRCLGYSPQYRMSATRLKETKSYITGLAFGLRELSDLWSTDWQRARNSLSFQLIRIGTAL